MYSTAQKDKLTFFVKLKEKRERKRHIDQVCADLRNQFAQIPGVKVSIVLNSGMKPEKPVQFVMRGESLDVLEGIANEAERIMEQIKGGVDITSTYKPGTPDAQVVIRREQAADLGVSTGVVANVLRTLYNGTVVSQFKDGDDRYDVRVRLEADNRRQLEDVTGIYLPGKYKDAAGKTVMVPLSQVTETVYSTSPSEIRRYDRQKEIRLTANLAGTSLGEFNKKAFEEFKHISMPPGYGFVTTGESERMGDTLPVWLLLCFWLCRLSFSFWLLSLKAISTLSPLCFRCRWPLLEPLWGCWLWAVI